jgi:hypothetical protein
LGVSADVLRRERARLARSASVPAGVDDVSGTDARPSRALAARIERFRAEWIALRAAHPTATRSELAGLAPDAARALHRYDGEWLNRHQPPSRRGGGARGAPRVAWAERDAAMRAEILAAAERVRAAAGRPRRVTRLALARGTSCADLVLHKRNRAKLPAMEAAVIAALESREDCARRRLQWAAAGYRDESRVPTAAELLARAGATARGLAGVLWAEAVAAAEALRAEVPRTPAI